MRPAAGKYLTFERDDYLETNSRFAMAAVGLHSTDCLRQERRLRRLLTERVQCLRAAGSERHGASAPASGFLCARSR